MGNIKPFNIANYSQKNSIALAYLTEAKKDSRKIKIERVRRSSTKPELEERNFMSEGEDRGKEKAYQRGI